MIFFKYGLQYSYLTREDLELVRQKRNSPEIQQFMEFREYITPEMQQAWYRTVNNANNCYYLIEYKGEKIGLINDKNIDWVKRTSESGLFLWDEKYYATHIPMLISIGMIEIGFSILTWKKNFAHILKSNSNAISFCTSLGYTRCNGQEDVENQLYELTQENFEKTGSSLRLLAEKLAGKNTPEYLFIGNEDYREGFADFVVKVKECMKDLPHHDIPGGEIYYRKASASIPGLE